MLPLLAVALSGTAAAAGSTDPEAACERTAGSPSTVYFAADDGVHGTELWATEGTSQGTRLVKDIATEGSSDPQLIGTMDGVLYFYADDGIHGPEPWRSDGTEEGTRLLADLRQSTKSSAPKRPRPSIVVGERLLFVARSAGNRLRSWSTDGTTLGTLPLAGMPPIGPKAEVDGIVYVFGEDEEGETVVWGTDGSPDGTRRISDPLPLLVHSDPISVRDQVFSTRGYSVDRDDATGWAAWLGGVLSDTGSNRAADDARTDLDVVPVTILDDRLLFYLDTGRGPSLWASDGTTEGTGPIGGISPRDSAAPDELPEPLAILDERAILLARGSEQGPSLWVTDGTKAGTSWLADLRWRGYDSMSWVVPVVADGRVY